MNCNTLIRKIKTSDSLTHLARERMFFCFYNEVCRHFIKVVSKCVFINRVFVLQLRVRDGAQKHALSGIIQNGNYGGMARDKMLEISIDNTNIKC